MTNMNKKRIYMILGLAWPVMFSQLLQTLLEIVDLYFVSNINSEEIVALVSGVGFSTSILGVFIVFSQLTATGAIAIISRRIGEKNDKEVFSITEQALILSLIVGFLIVIGIYIFMDPLLDGIGASGNVHLYAKNYLSIVLVGVPFMFFNLTGRSVLQAMGDTKTPMVIFVSMNVINIIFDPILIYGYSIFPELGYRGAALATLVSNIVAFLLMLYVIFSKVYKKDFKHVIRSFKIDVKVILRIIKIGFYSAIQAISRPITGLLMFKIASYTGTNSVAAFTIGGRMFNLVFIILMGLTTSISVLTGQNLGKGDIEEAENYIKDGLKIAAINMIIFIIPYFIFSEGIIRLFIEDIEVIKIGSNYLRIVYLGVIFVIYPVVYGGAFLGSGDTLPPMLASLVANWAFKLPIAYIFAKVLNMGANWVWLAISISVFVEAIVIIAWFRKGRWKEKVV
ncbi:MATE family efflux transporter [Clostridium sp. D2Q-11]|uniref:Probable multidrug resistance protein NorM n=1 Tax=Anaeromonas frigoriresistens TaxID=2683708 RepID=A0A942Z865_9FIRM|nr:MATE family efflux transporter [Anaeromonas frigoriresistens]MBS4537968.1 MATE family efflux transporter [Anaeromonas frigoriresistens]